MLVCMCMCMCMCMFGAHSSEDFPFYGGACVGPCPPDVVREVSTVGNSSHLQRPFSRKSLELPTSVHATVEAAQVEKVASVTRSELSRRVPNPAFGHAKLHYAGT